MAIDEQTYIALCKRMIEKKFAFGSGKGHGQRNLRSLAQRIEEKTGILVSLSTLKRIWKGNYKQSPQLATLDALAGVLDYKDWEEFKMRNGPLTRQHRLRRARMVVLAVVAGLIGVLAMFVGFINKREGKIRVDGPVIFTTNKTVATGTPNTVIFNYDLSRVRADSFFVQQSWNPFDKMPVDPDNNIFTSIYYESGFHRARLIANDSVVAMQPVHILSNGWEPHVYYSYEEDFVHFRGENFIADGRLHLDSDLLNKRNVDFSRSFFSRIGYSRDFGVSSDYFNLVSRIKLDSVSGKPCPIMQVMVVTEKHIFWVKLQNKGCARFAGYKMGEVVRFGEENDLSALGTDLYNWQEVGISVENKNAEIRINGRTAFRETFKEDFGDIMGLIYIFDGTGSIDHVRLTGTGEEPMFEESF